MGDMYGDQYSPDMSMRPEGGFGRARGSMSVGFYEDNFRQEQYGRPAALECGAPNPYIQDDIRKNQRLRPIRLGSVNSRENQILARQYADTVEIPSHSLQRTYRVPIEGGDRTPAYCGECSNSSCRRGELPCNEIAGPGSCLGRGYVPSPGTGIPVGLGPSCAAPSHNGMASGGSGSAANTIDVTMGGTIGGVSVFLIFIFLVLVFLCVYCWRSVADIRENMQVMKEALSSQNR